MVTCERPLLGLALACIGLLGSIISCALPTWRIMTPSGDNKTPTDFKIFEMFEHMTAFKDYKMVEGLWKICPISPTGEMQCMGYEDKLLPADMKAARGFIIIAIIIEVLGILLGVAGRNFMNFVPDERQRRKMALTSGIAFLIAGFFVLIPVSWTTNNINDHFHPNDLYHRVLKKMELGAALYIGWFTTVLLFLGGGLVCSSFFRRNGTGLTFLLFK